MSSIPTPHQEAIAKIQRLTTEDIAKLKIWQVLALAVPEGEIEALANMYGKASKEALYSWRVDPDLFRADGTLKDHDPNGRRGIAHHFNMFVLALNARFPAGAQLLLRWQMLQLAEAQAIQGHNAMLAVLQVADEADEIMREAQALQEKISSWKARILAATGGAAMGSP